MVEGARDGAGVIMTVDTEAGVIVNRTEIGVAASFMDASGEESIAE